MKNIYNRKEAVKIAGISQRTILRAIHALQLDAEKISKGKTSAYIIKHEDLVEYKEKRKERQSQ